MIATNWPNITSQINQIQILPPHKQDLQTSLSSNISSESRYNYNSKESQDLNIASGKGGPLANKSSFPNIWLVPGLADAPPLASSAKPQMIK